MTMEGDDLARQMRKDLEEIGRTFMPFRKFGPVHYPPNGFPIYDLRAEYLMYFANDAAAVLRSARSQSAATSFEFL